MNLDRRIPIHAERKPGIKPGVLVAALILFGLYLVIGTAVAAVFHFF